MRSALILMCWMGCVGAAMAAEPPKVRVLLLSGANNHDFKTTTPALRKLLDESGRFSVTVTDEVDKLTPLSLKDQDLILSNWNTFTTRAAPPRPVKWNDDMRKAFVDFVSSGKGHLGIHAGTASFYDWPEYHQAVLGTFKIGQTSHGKQHAFEVRFASVDHPVSRGLKNFTTTDELWHNTQFQPGVTVLASAFSSRESGGSGKDEPVAVAAEVGKGRSVFLVLGHDARAIQNESFRTLVVRSALWSAGQDPGKQP